MLTFPTIVLCATGLAAEARIARAAGFSTVVGAGDRERTAALVESAVRQASCLVSFGVAGGLAPELRAGDVVMSTEVVSESGRWRAEASFRTRIGGLAAEIGAIEGPVLGAARIMSSMAEKRRNWVETGALAVDLESDVVARTIADTAHRELPPAALIPLAGDGTPNLARVLACVMRRPRQLAALLGLARETRTALAALVLPARALHGLVATA